MRKTLSLALALTLSTILFAIPASAQLVAVIDYVGFGWEDGGFPTSDPGDVLEVYAVGTSLDPIFGVDLGTEEVTVHLYDLVSAGEVDVSGNTVISYVGGMIDVYSDTAMDADWGTFPPAGATGWTNGTKILAGAFNDFTLVVNGFGAGAFEGNIDGIGGTVAELCNNCEYTFGGAFTKDTGAQIPDGYDLQIDGTLEVDTAVSTTQTSFGKIKSLY